MPQAAGIAMPALTPPPVAADGVALFLDLDGVLAPIAPTPEAVGPDVRRTAVLKALDARLDGRLAIISGRTIAEIDRISDGAARAASGVHGLERRRSDARVEQAPAAPGVAAAATAFRDFAAARPGLSHEDKRASTTLHYRGAPQHAEAAARLAETLASENGLTLQPGHMVLELKTPGADKGTALSGFMTAAPFAGATPVMLGDDLTDEDAFRAAEIHGGYGVLVGPERATAARYRLADTAAVMDWLEAVAGAPR